MLPQLIRQRVTEELNIEPGIELSAYVASIRVITAFTQNREEKQSPLDFKDLDIQLS